MRPIVLSGFMGTGKSTVGPVLAARLGVPFVDTDVEIERAAGASIAELWKRDGEAVFRTREAELAERLLSEKTPRVIAFGGGAVTSKSTRRLAGDRAIVVSLTSSPETIVARVGDTRHRPNLAASDDPIARARDLLEQRAAAYAECHLTLSTETLDTDAVVREIVDCARREPLLVSLGARSYTVDFCSAEPARLSRALLQLGASSIVMVTDSNVQAKRGTAIDAALASVDVPVRRVVLEPGETHKTIDAVRTIWDASLESKVDRDAVVLVVGGGVVGDLAGFAAASLLRGVRFVQAPTTLLSMVDSSVGGKTGFDHPAGKNLIGAFHQPSGVVVDVAHLETLDRRQRRAGLAEVVKIAVATDAALLDAVEQRARDLDEAQPSALVDIIRGAIQAKVLVVRDDEHESGRRALLNLGHTIGHAIEAQGGFDRWLHGEAVAIGTALELAACVRLGWTPPHVLRRVSTLLATLGLPTQANREELEAAWPYVAADKKRGGDFLRLPVVTSPGCAEVRRVSLSTLKAALFAA